MSDTPIADTALLRLAHWLEDKPSFGDMRLIDKGDKVMVGDVREALKQALSLSVLQEMMHQSVGADDRDRKLASILMDALGDREMLNALERVGGVLRRERMELGPIWKFDHTVPEVAPQEDPDLRSVLAAVRRQADNSATLQAVAEAELVG